MTHMRAAAVTADKGVKALAIALAHILDVLLRQSARGVAQLLPAAADLPSAFS
jgi:hypothetical protein